MRQNSIQQKSAAKEIVNKLVNNEDDEEGVLNEMKTFFKEAISPKKRE